MWLAMLMFTGAILAGCNSVKPSPVIELVIPDGYSGPFVVIELNGNVDALEVVEGVHRITIPMSGIAHIHDGRVFRQWHRTRARFVSANQQSIVLLSELDLAEAKADEVLLLKGDSMSGQHGIVEHWFYVGLPATIKDTKKSDKIREQLETIFRGIE